MAFKSNRVVVRTTVALKVRSLVELQVSEPRPCLLERNTYFPQTACPLLRPSTEDKLDVKLKAKEKNAVIVIRCTLNSVLKKILK